MRVIERHTAVRIPFFFPSLISSLHLATTAADLVAPLLQQISLHHHRRILPCHHCCKIASHHHREIASHHHCGILSHLVVRSCLSTMCTLLTGHSHNNSRKPQPLLLLYVFYCSYNFRSESSNKWFLFLPFICIYSRYESSFFSFAFLAIYSDL